LTLALSFADVALEAVLVRQRDAGTGGPLGGPAAEIDRHPQLFQAQGMVMVQLGIGIDEALARMRACAYAENLRLGEVARDIVERRLRLDRDPS
jgi:hypothetical protein